MKTELEMAWSWLVARFQTNRNEDGVSAVEYALLAVAAIGFIGIVAAAVTGYLNKIVSQLQ